MKKSKKKKKLKKEINVMEKCFFPLFFQNGIFSQTFYRIPSVSFKEKKKKLLKQDFWKDMKNHLNKICPIKQLY